MSDFTLYHGDCLDVLAELADNSMDSIVTDPPAGISFMNMEFDHDKGGRDKWIKWLSSIMKQCLRVLKPGGHAAVWALPRTSHWTGMALELAGFEVRDCISYLYDSGRDVTAFLETLSAEQRNMLEIILANGDDTFTNFLHVFGQGFPKSLNVSAAIDSHLGHEREVVGQKLHARDGDVSHQNWSHNKVSSRLYVNGNQTLGAGIITAPASVEAKQWDGWHTSLKPAFENWWLVRKPLSEPTIAANVLRWGTGGLNIDASRVPTGDDENFAKNWDRETIGDMSGGKYHHQSERIAQRYSAPTGRFPSNIIHDGSDTVEAEFAKAGVSASKLANRGRGLSTNGSNDGWKRESHDNPMYQNYERGHNDTGTPSRFFYCAKPSSRERNEGLDGFEEKIAGVMNMRNDDHAKRNGETSAPKRNIHPTVKSLELMKYLITMLTPKGGTVLDCFMGSGSTGVAAMKSGFKFVGIEKERPYFEIAEARIRHANLGRQGEIIAPEPLPVKAKVKLQMEMF